MADNTGKNKSNKTLMFVIIAFILVIVLIVGVVFGFFFINSTIKNKGMELNSQEIIEEGVLQIEEFVTNIKDENSKRYVKCAMSITYDSKNKDILEDINNNLHKIRDTVITIFKSKGINDIDNEEGMNIVKEEIKVKIKEILEPGNEIIGVYFTNLLIH